MGCDLIEDRDTFYAERWCDCMKNGRAFVDLHLETLQFSRKRNLRLCEKPDDIISAFGSRLRLINSLKSTRKYALRLPPTLSYNAGIFHVNSNYTA